MREMQSIYTMYAFTCSNCGIVVCLLYKVYIRRQPVGSHRPLLLWKVNSAIQDGDGQCFLLIICKEYDPVYLAALLALSTIGD
jgi:hypothetical protein